MGAPTIAPPPKSIGSAPNNQSSTQFASSNSTVSQSLTPVPESSTSTFQPLNQGFQPNPYAPTDMTKAQELNNKVVDSATANGNVDPLASMMAPPPSRLPSTSSTGNSNDPFSSLTAPPSRGIRKAPSSSRSNSGKSKKPAIKPMIFRPVASQKDHDSEKKEIEVNQDPISVDTKMENIKERDGNGASTSVSSESVVGANETKLESKVTSPTPVSVFSSLSNSHQNEFSTSEADAETNSKKVNSQDENGQMMNSDRKTNEGNQNLLHGYNSNVYDNADTYPNNNTSFQNENENSTFLNANQQQNLAESENITFNQDDQNYNENAGQDGNFPYGEDNQYAVNNEFGVNQFGARDDFVDDFA